ncbi:MAG: RIP metalloprotease RseP [Cyclobacteriaceae bacterium]
MEGLVMTAQLLLGLSILVGLHEFGHLLAAKAFGMRVEKYSIGFPPKIWGKKIGETEYSFGLIPLGGFVKISGMIDESLDTKSLSAEPEPYEFRAKPAWQRLIVMMGGIIVNVITGIIIFIILSYSQGETYIAKNEVNRAGIAAYELGEEIGFQTGDKIISVNGQDFEKFRDLISGDILLGTDTYYMVERNGEQLRIDLPNDFIDRIADQDKSSIFISYRSPFVIGRLADGYPAADAGLQIGDKFVSVDGASIKYYDEFQAAVKGKKEEKIHVVIERDGAQKEIEVWVNEQGQIGFNPRLLINKSKIDYSFGESITKGTSQAFGVVWLNIKGFSKMFSGDVSPSKSLSGPIGIAKFFGGTWDWVNFWQITGLISMVLAFMNFLPIPALDGGHVVFLTWEMVSGRKPSDKFLENAQKVGMILLLGLMTFAIFNDIIKLF